MSVVEQCGNNVQTMAGGVYLVTAGLVSTLISGGSMSEAAFVGNLAASITVTKLGTTGSASPEEVIRQLSG